MPSYTCTVDKTDALKYDARMLSERWCASWHRLGRLARGQGPNQRPRRGRPVVGQCQYPRSVLVICLAVDRLDHG